MTTSYVPINNGQLAIAALLIVINVVLSIALQLRLEKQLWIGAVRMTVQLLLIGYVLKWIFTLQSPWLVLAVTLMMTILAGQSAIARTKRRYRGIFWNCFISIFASSALMIGVIVVGIIRVEPWYNPQYVIPILGMILGNALTGASLALDRFTEDLIIRRDQIEALLALGATRWEAAQQTIQEALRTGMIPTINQMMVMGTVSLPGTMTGQIIAGANPTDAVRYQIVLIFAIAAGTGLATIGIVLLGFRSLFNVQHQLRLDRLHLREKA
ncbi:iron export ABC transporter permease subunit FetB [Leptolyngbya sp. FACHB-17]|uniref:ABC transporter permease n=1 Tax=unclassified Leptolyngbya TaxID=2650499 RepID=UPI0016802781|nr:iron export ABC transporter permease subunit FetB [Leptolyngbya sp. FACHB-17]MBD2078958.1 iron export ABC transporter permease subunit FetB [Leptolyngbya sp. FACHB-17]